MANSREELILPVPACPEGKHGHLSRFTFQLPDPIAVNDNFVSLQLYQTEPLDTWAQVVVRQVSLKDPSVSTYGAGTITVLREEGALPDTDEPLASEQSAKNSENPWIEDVSVVQVTTPYHSPSEPPFNWNGSMRNLEPSQDAFMRSLHATQTVARAANLASEYPPARLPTYERLLPTIFVQLSVALERLTPDSLESVRWGDPERLVLDKQYFGRLQSDHAQSNEIFAWQQEIGYSNPAVVVKEQLQRAKRLMEVDGEYAQAVLAAAIGIEALCYKLFFALKWESACKSNSEWERDLEETGDTLASGRTPIQIAASHLPALLGGDWSSPTSPFGRYRDLTTPLRNRIVHIGYLPTRNESEAAVTQALEAQTFMFDRLGYKRRTYPWVTYIFLGEPGLASRGLLNAEYQNAFAQLAQTEPQPSMLYAQWNDLLNERSAPDHEGYA